MRADQSLSEPPPPSYNSLHFPSKPVSRITLKAFGKSYASLDKNKLISNSAFFNDLLMPPSFESIENENAEFDSFKGFGYSSNSKYTGDISFVIQLDDISYELPFTQEYSVITKDSFELILQRMNGDPDLIGEREISNEVSNAAKYFGVGIKTTNSDYYSALSSSLAGVSGTYEKNSTMHGTTTMKYEDELKSKFLSIGWKLEPEQWDIIPINTLIEILKSDFFYVPDEFHRALIIIKLFERRNDPTIFFEDYTRIIHILKEALDHEVIYSTIAMEKLLKLKGFKDIDAVPYISKSIIQDAIDQQYLLRKKLSCSEHPQLSYAPEDPEFFKTYKFINDDNLELGYNSLLDIEDFIKQCAYQKSSVPPIRVSFTFADLNQLQDSTALILRPFHYAGSYWEVFLARKKIESTSANTSTLSKNRNSIEIGIRRNKSLYRRLTSFGNRYRPIMIEDVDLNDYYYRVDLDGRETSRADFVPKLYSPVSKNIGSGGDSDSEYVDERDLINLCVRYYAYFDHERVSNEKRKRELSEAFEINFRNSVREKYNVNNYFGLTWNSLINDRMLEDIDSHNCESSLKICLVLGLL